MCGHIESLHDYAMENSYKNIHMYGAGIGTVPHA